MNKTKILDWTPPFITSFPQHANLISMIQSNPNSFPWIYNHYVQLRINQKPNRTANLDFCTGDNWEMIKRCPFLEVYSQPFSKINTTYSSIIDYIIESIDFGLYVILPVDWFYISTSNAYNKWHINHDLLCFGYDADKRLLHVADFLGNQQYNHYICTYYEIETSYNSIDFSQYCIINAIYTLKVQQNQSYKFNAELFKTLLKDYLLSHNSNKHFYPIKTEDFLDTQSFSYGISIYEELVHLLICRHSSHKKIPIRSFHILYDHKVLLEKAFIYLTQEGFYISNDSLSCFQQLVKDALAVRTLLIKYNITGKSSIINECIDKLYCMKEAEISILTKAETNISETPSIKILQSTEFSLCNTCWNKTQSKDSFIYTSYFLGDELTIPPELHPYINSIRIDQVNYSISTTLDYIKCEYGYHTISLHLNSCVFPNVFIQNNSLFLTTKSNSARYIGQDNITLGNWINTYGENGYEIIGLENKSPDNIFYITHNINRKIWNLNTDEKIALENPFSSSNIAGCLFTSQSGSLEFLITGTQEQKITFYVMDWYGYNRDFTINIKDADSKHSILTCNVSCHNTGIYYMFMLKGHILVEIQNVAEPIAPISGIFYD